MTVREVGERMDASEAAEWVAFDRINQPESWHQAAQICAVMDGLWSKKPRKLEAFLPRRARPRSGPVPAGEIRARFAAFRKPAPPARRGT